MKECVRRYLVRHAMFHQRHCQLLQTIQTITRRWNSAQSGSIRTGSMG